MNKHIELVKKWLADKGSVSSEELRENAADATYYPAIAAYAADVALYAANAEYWVSHCEGLVNE